MNSTRINGQSPLLAAYRRDPQAVLRVFARISAELEAHAARMSATKDEEHADDETEVMA